MSNLSSIHQILFYPSSLSFTGLKTVTTSTQTLTLTTFGKIPSATCSSPSITGSDSSFFSIVSETCSNKLLTSTVSCQVVLQATPDSARLFSASLEVSCGDKTALAALSMTGENFSVVSIIPSNGATGVDPNQSVLIQFSHPLNLSLIDHSTIKLSEAVGHAAVPYIKSYNALTNTLTLTPQRSVTGLQQLRLKLTTNIASESGSIPLSDVKTSMYTTANVRVWGHGMATTSSTPTIRGGCSRNVTTLSATLNGTAVALLDSNCADGTWAVTPTLTSTDANFTLVVTGVTAGGATSSKSMNLRQCSVMSAIVPNSTYSETGTVDDPYLIYTPEQLAGMAFGLGGNYKLANDIDLRCKSWASIGTAATPFAGTFHGNYKTISNLVVEASSANQGLFGFTTGSLIQKLLLTDVVVSANGNAATAGVAGYAGDTSTIKKIFVSGILLGGTQQGAIAGKIYQYTSILDNLVEIVSQSPSGSKTGGMVGFSDTLAAPAVNYFYRNIATVSGKTHLNSIYFQ